MSHTPEQAKELWCPMAKYAVKSIRIPDESMCIAEKCAMWRWMPSTTTHPERIVRDTFADGTSRDPDRRFVEKTIHVLDMPTHGYCGLAGRPEVM